MAHSLEVCQAFQSTSETWRSLLRAVADDDLSAPEETDSSVVELSRQFPNLPREIAEYLAR